MTKLSVNINKFATLRNARGGNNPDIVKVAIDCERFGADGITVHPRPDERHITYKDVYQLSKVITTEFNIEGNPRDAKFIELVLDVRPTQVTLVPDETNQLTSNHGWDTIKNKEFLYNTIHKFKSAGIRTSIFINPNFTMIEAAVHTHTDRIELYTESYASHFMQDKEQAVKEYCIMADLAKNKGMGLNAGHDLNLENLKYFKENVSNLLEVSIGHALVCDALYFGLENTIQLYKKQLSLPQ